MQEQVIRRVGFMVLMFGMCVWAATYERAPDEPTTASDADGSADTANTGVVGMAAPDPGTVTGKLPTRRDGGLRDSDRSPTHPGLTVAQARTREAIIARARKLEADNTARYATHTETWNAETRDPSWAKPIEDDLRQMLVDSDVDHLLLDITCRKTMCRLTTEVLDSHSAISLTAVPGLIEAFGGDQNSYATEGPPSDRKFIFLGPAPR